MLGIGPSVNVLEIALDKKCLLNEVMTGKLFIDLGCKNGDISAACSNQRR